MLSSVTSIDSTGLASNRGVSRFPGLRAAAVLAAIGSMTLTAAGQDYDGDILPGDGGSDAFDNPLSWGGAYPGGAGNDFGGGIIDILGLFEDGPINVANDIIGIGGLSNTFDGDVVFNGDGSFTFADTAIINPNDNGSFTFEINVIADGSLTFDLTGGGLVQIDGAFTTTNGGTILAEGGFVDVNGETTSGEGTVWNANDGGFNFNGAFNATGGQTFAGLSGTVADDVFTFNDVNFLNGVDPLTDIATFDAATVDFNGVTTVAAGYGFDLNNAAVVTFDDFVAEGDHTINFLDADSSFTVGGDASFIDNATLAVTGEGEAGFGGEVTLGQNFTANVVDADSKITFRGTTIFESDSNLTVQGLGTFQLGGSAELPGPFTLLVSDGGTANWFATTTLDGDFTIDTTQNATNGANVNFGSVAVDAGGGFANAAGADDLTIDITTDGTDDTVKFAGGFLREFTGTINVNDDSAVTFEGGGAGGNGTTSLQLGANTNVTLDSGTGGGTIAFDQLIGSDTVGAITATGNDDITLSVKGGGSSDDPETGLYMGEITDITAAGNAGKLSLTVTEGTFNYGGVASYTGNTTISGGGTFRIDGDGLNTGLVTDTDSLLVTGGTLLLETSARLTGEGEVGVASGSTIDITADANNGANLEFDDAGSIEGVMTLSGDRLGAYNLIFGNSTVDDSAIRGSLTASGNSGAFFAGDLTVAGGGRLLLEDTAIVEVGGDLSVGGLVEIGGDGAFGVSVAGGLDITTGGQVQLSGSRSMVVDSSSSMAANTGLMLDDTSFASVDGDLDNAGTISLNDATNLTVSGSITGDGIMTLAGTATAIVDVDAALSVLQVSDDAAFTVTGNLDLTRTSSFEAGASLSVGDILTIGDGTDAMSLIFSGNSAGQTTVTATNGIELQAGSTLVANADIDTSVLNYAGDVLVGVVGENRGVLNLKSGDLRSDSSDATVTINLTGDYVNDLAGGTIFSQTSVINVAAGMSDFTDGGDIFIDVQDAAYIPDDKDIILLNSPGGITGAASVTTSQDESITRTWDTNPDNGGGLDPLTQLWARSAADYASPLEGTPEYLRGVELNSLRGVANDDPDSDSGILLGALDTIDTLEAYEAAIDGVGPTVQISAVQLATNTQYFNVLRKEIQRRHATVQQRTPAPFRLSNGTDYMSAQDDAVQTKIRRAVRQPSTAEGFGVFWGRSIDTPDEGNIAGISGNEYGGLGGFAWDLSEQWVAGVNLGYSQLSGDVNGGFGNTRVGTVRGGGFVSWDEGGGLFLDMQLAGAWNHYDFTRLVPNTGLSATSKADGFEVDLSVGGGYRVELGESWAITPEASILYSYLSTGDINEDRSSAAALDISPGDLNALIGRVGGTLSWSALPGLVIDGSLGWQGNFNFNSSYDVSLANQATKLNIAVDNQTINTAYYGLGVNWTPTYNVNVSLQYEGRNGEGFTSNMFYGGISIGF